MKLSHRTPSFKYLFRFWSLPVVLSFYILWLGDGRVFNNLMGQYWVGLKTLAPSMIMEVCGFTLLFAAIFFFFGKRLRKHLTPLLVVLLTGGQLVCLLSALPYISSNLQWGIDHPAFLFRLKEFREILPCALGSYNPWWNAGTEHFIGVTSGTHSYALLNLPLLIWRDPHHFHGMALGFWLILGFPWLATLTVRSAGVRWSGALCAGLLMLGFSRSQFLFFWQSGNVGAMTSAMLSLPLVTLGYRIAILRRGGWGTVLALALAAWLVALWSPGFFVGAGVLAAWLLMRDYWSLTFNRRFIVAGCLALLLLSPWLWTTLYPCRGIVDFVAGDVMRPALKTILRSSYTQTWRRLQEWHPLLLVYGLGGTFCLAPRSVRRWMFPILTVCALVTLSIGWRPHTQLDRMALPMGVISIFPAAIIIRRILEGSPLTAHLSGRLAQAFLQGLVFTMLVMGLRVAELHFSCQGGFKLWPAPQIITEFCDWIKDNVPEEGRLGFAGSTDWRYEWGKPSYFPILTGREMMADDYYSYPKGLIEYNYPPKAYRKSLETWLSFTEAYGITHWATANSRHKEFLASYPELFELVWEKPMQSRHVEVYKVRNMSQPSRFLQGSGKVAARENQIEVMPASPYVSSRLVIRYNWRDGLRCLTPGATIEPFDLDGKICFIAINPGTNSSVKIGYRPLAQPLKPNYDGTFHH